jgi:hypothetical protein
MVLVNNYNREVLGSPFGGVKHRSYGREHTIATLADFAQPKMIRFPSGLGQIPYWRSVTRFSASPVARLLVDGFRLPLSRGRPRRRGLARHVGRNLLHRDRHRRHLAAHR